MLLKNNELFLMLKNIFVLLNIFVKIVILFQGSLINRKFKIAVFILNSFFFFLCKQINFDNFNAFLLNKSINLFYKNLIDTILLNGCVFNTKSHKKF